jgi:hypothetical protein
MFRLVDVDMWVDKNKPTQIEMCDGQYAWFSQLAGMNLKTHLGIPIVFVDAPMPV